MRLFSYDGTMEFDKLNDAQIRSNYQHRHVIDYFLPFFKNKKVLDAGCWTGTLEKEIASRKMRTTLVGIDENKSALKVAQKNFSQFTFTHLNLVDPNPDFTKKYTGYFDTIVFLDVIEHVPVGTEAMVLRYFNTLLKPKGHLILSTMLSHRYNFIDPAWFFGHRHYTLERMRQLLKYGGLHPKKILKLGNLFWDFDILLLYIYKHLFHRNYVTPNFIFNRILSGLRPNHKNATRIYLIAEKNKK